MAHASVNTTLKKYHRKPNNKQNRHEWKDHSWTELGWSLKNIFFLWFPYSDLCCMTILHPSLLFHTLVYLHLFCFLWNLDASTWYLTKKKKEERCTSINHNPMLRSHSLKNVRNFTTVFEKNIYILISMKYNAWNYLVYFCVLPP